MELRITTCDNCNEYIEFRMFYRYKQSYKAKIYLLNYTAESQDEETKQPSWAHNHQNHHYVQTFPIFNLFK